jgi:hypothetical protein
MRRLYPLAVMLGVLVILRAAPVRAAEPNSNKPTNVTVSFFSSNCPSFDGKLIYKDMDDGNKDRSIAASAMESSLYQISLYAAPGFHRLWIRAASAGNSLNDQLCVAFVPIAVLAGHSRHVTTALGEQVTPHSDCALAGALPASGFQVDLILPKGHLMANSTTGGYFGPAQQDLHFGGTVDGDAYYVQHILPMDFVLRVSANGRDVDIPIDLTKQGDPTQQYCLGVFVRHIKAQELKTLFPPEFVTE